MLQIEDLAKLTILIKMGKMKGFYYSENDHLYNNCI